MIGGYLSFSGFQARAAYRQTKLAEVLPVTMLAEDDRVELPSGARPQIAQADHPALGGAGEEWPHLLGYNRVIAEGDAEVLASLNGDPLVVVDGYGSGRGAAFTSDCSPHWAPVEFCEQWSGYASLFDGLVTWLGQR
jgi:uncharacterized membrane protein